MTRGSWFPRSAPDTSLRPDDWRDHAECRPGGPVDDAELFFPIGSTGLAYELAVEEAKAVCRRCAVPAECLHFALETGQEAGIWGGQTEDERRAIKRRRAALNKAQQRGKQR